MGVVAPYETTDRSVAVGDRGTQTRITNLIARRNRKSEGVYNESSFYVLQSRFSFLLCGFYFCMLCA